MKDPNYFALQKLTVAVCGMVLLGAARPIQLQAIPPVKFSQPTFFATANAQQVAVQDFNGDGKPDFAVATRLPNSVVVYTNSGNGSFGISSNYSMPNQAFTIAADDLNGDGKTDIVAGMGSSFTVLTNDGSGTFGAESNYPILTNANQFISSIALGDFNGDHKLDIAAGIQAGNLVTVLLNNGDATFGSPTNFSTGSTASIAPNMIALADLNHDGIIDIVTANWSDAGTISVMLGRGDGSFETGVLYSPKGHPISVVIGDFNNDGIPDILATDAGENSVALLTGNGDGTFGVASTNNVAIDPTPLAAGDFNGDGNLDAVLIHNIGASTVAKGILLGRGNGTFVVETNSVSQTPAKSVAVADWNGDSQPDIVVVANSSISVFLNQSLPELQIHPHDNDIVLQWPDWTGYLLQTTVNLDATNSWTTLSGTPTLINHQKFLTNSTAGTNQFFRLSHP